MPLFQTRFEDLGGDLVVLAVNVDDSLSGATGFVEEFGLSFPVVIDREGDVKEAYRVGNGLPKSYFVDAEGVLQSVITGEVSEARLDEELEALGLPASGS
jgi:peroxiredoxin